MKLKLHQIWTGLNIIEVKTTTFYILCSQWPKNQFLTLKYFHLEGGPPLGVLQAEKLTKGVRWPAAIWIELPTRCVTRENLHAKKIRGKIQFLQRVLRKIHENFPLVGEKLTWKVMAKADFWFAELLYSLLSLDDERKGNRFEKCFKKFANPLSEGNLTRK